MSEQKKNSLKNVTYFPISQPVVHNWYSCFKKMQRARPVWGGMCFVGWLMLTLLILLTAVYHGFFLYCASRVEWVV